jgi:hypothetical protein
MEDGCWHDFSTEEEQAVAHAEYVKRFEAKYHRPYTFENWVLAMGGRLLGCTQCEPKYKQHGSVDDGVRTE